jgi:Cu(I)/Ag(I) efflux system membrane fusion protein
MRTPAKFTIAVFLAAGIFVAGYMASRQPAPTVSSASVRRVLYYTCPMHPNIKSDHPGDAPCCGMRMIPVYADAGGSREQKDAVPGAVRVSAEKQQLIGVRTEETRLAPASETLRIPGRVAVDDTRLYRIVAAADGWISGLGQNPAGVFVKRDQVLASYYVRDLVASQQTFLIASGENARLQAGNPNLVQQRLPQTLNLQLALDTLRTLGMTDTQVKELEETGRAASEIQVRSPASGFVLERNISPGQRFDKGLEMYRIGDLSRVWVVADAFEKDREFLRPGAMAAVSYQGRIFHARLADALPQLDPQSRTLKTRFELDNPGFLLQPGMFVDVELPVAMPAALTVPSDAVVESGAHRAVFVQAGEGVFEPRTVETGWEMGGLIQIISGLHPGERVVVSGNFLIDSESRMQLASAGYQHEHGGAAAKEQQKEKDPVCGMEVDPKSPDTLKTEHGGRTYYFCSDHCKKAFEADPDKYVPKKKAAGDGKAGRGTA